MNKRAPEMWRQIIEHVDFTDKLVIDIGCGTGDFLWRAMAAGAEHAYGVDVDKYTAREARNNSIKMGYKPTVFIDDAENLDVSEFDIAICFSVIPYFRNPTKVMKWMSTCAKQSLIECQYRGDGPGLANIENDDDMKLFLNMFWPVVKPIGSTDVVIRPARRTIWLCTK